MRASREKSLLNLRPEPTKLASAVLAVLGLVFAVGGVRLGLWADGGPGPGLLPAVAAVLMLGLIAVMLSGRLEPEEPFRREPIVAIALGCAFAALAPRIGIVVPGVVMVAIWVRVLHCQSWLRAGILGIGLISVGVLLFHVLLKVPMPLIVGAP